MTTKEMKALYEVNPDEWIILCWSEHGGTKNNYWYPAHPSRTLNSLSTSTYRLINIKHKHILDAYLADNNVEIEWMTDDGDGYGELKVDFIESYYHNWEYRLKEKEDVPMEEINSFTDCGFTANHKVDDTYIGYIFNSKKINNFQDYGFTADFEGEILKDFKTSFFGYIIERCPDDSGNYYSYCQWDRDGKAYRDNKSFSQYNLTPIKKEWYENPDNFPCMLIKDNLYREETIPDMIICHNKHNWSVLYSKSWRLATKEEVMSLYFEGKEQ